MSILSKLKLVNAVPERQTTSLSRRTRLVEKIAEQLASAQALSRGAVHKVVRTRRVLDAATGIKQTVEQSRPIRPWWWTVSSGRMMVAIRYGASQLEIAKGKNAIEVAGIHEVITTLEIMRQAVEAGELDAQITAASEAISDGFEKRA